MPQRISAVAIVVVVLSAFMPWVSLLGFSKSGVEGDGVITLVVALAGAVLLVVTGGAVGSPRTPSRASQIVLLVLAAIVSLVALLDMSGLAAVGLYLTLLGGIAWVVGAAWQLTLKKQDDAVPDAPQDEF